KPKFGEDHTPSVPLAPPGPSLPARPTIAAPSTPANSQAAPPPFQGEKPRLRATGDDVLPIPTDDPVTAN
ncbi:MAG: hypothetical protein KDM63_15495, partial [Verrucomicrobiae bacterium]|nr:hypothetical protein [Verrucomicrobiae bacterium]